MTVTLKSRPTSLQLFELATEVVPRDTISDAAAPTKVQNSDADICQAIHYLLEAMIVDSHATRKDALRRARILLTIELERPGDTK